MKVWVLTTGSYSDYAVRGLFSSLDKIEEYKAKYPCSWSGYNDPFDMVIDECVHDNGLTKYYVIMYRDGNKARAEPRDAERSTSIHGKYMVAYVSARNEKHAIKIVNERRVQLIASGMWPNESTFKNNVMED